MVGNGDVLANLKAFKGGQCNDMLTNKGSWGCGLATKLMEFCFTDPDIGGVDLATEPTFNQEAYESKHFRDMAIKNCDHVVYLECLPKSPATDVSCSAYLSAALNTHHSMMLTFSNETLKWNLLPVAKAQAMLKNDADELIGGAGREWFFCKCKGDKTKQCKDM